MALIKCKECGNMVSDKAKACPKCGCPVDAYSDSQMQEDNAYNPDSNPQEDYNYGSEPPQDNYDYYPEPEDPHKNRKLYVIFAVLVLVIAGGVGFYIYSQKQSKLRTAQLEEARIEQLHQDSIEADQLAAARLDSIRKDSIAKEEKLRFTARALIKDMTYEKYEWGGLYAQEVRGDWESKLKNLGFEKQSKVLREKNVGDYDDEVYDIYGIPFTRTLNGRTITVEPQYVDGRSFIDNSHEGASFGVSFSDSEDYNYFKKSLIGMGMSKDGGYYQTDPKKYKGGKKGTSEDATCPSVMFKEKGKLSIAIYNNVDC